MKELKECIDFLTGNYKVRLDSIEGVSGKYIDDNGTIEATINVHGIDPSEILKMHEYCMKRSVRLLLSTNYNKH